MNPTKNLGILFILTTLVAMFSCGMQPSYQVSLYVHLHPRAPPIHLCNGVIVQNRLVLTTASCVHYQLSASSPVVAILPTMLSVTSGQSTPFGEELTNQVTDILLANDFNYTTGENDLALLRLNNKLPLDTRNDINWIILEDDDFYDGPCLVNLYVQTSLDGSSNYIQSEELPILDTELCATRTEYAANREDDICSLYYLTTDFNCNNYETLLNYNEDRGMGFVCENKLVGILSTILPMQNRSDCTENPIKAYYTSLAPHLGWIYNVISEEELKMINQGLYMYSSPYAGETNAFVQPDLAASGSTVANAAGNATNATEELSVSGRTNATDELSASNTTNATEELLASGRTNATEELSVSGTTNATEELPANNTTNATEELSDKHNSAPRVINMSFLTVIFGIYLLLRSFSF